MKRLALIGSKEFAQQIRSYAENTGDYFVVGYFDDFENVGTLKEGLPILGGIEDIESVYKDDIFDCIFFASGYNNFGFRESVFVKLKGKVPFANIIMKGAYIHPTASIGEGVFIGVGSTIDSGSVVEDNVFIHGYTYIAHDNRIGAHTYISGRCNTAGFCSIGKRNFIGICVCMSDNVSVCDDVWIGLACVVAKNIKQPGKYMSPAAKLYKIE